MIPILLLEWDWFFVSTISWWPNLVDVFNRFKETTGLQHATFLEERRMMMWMPTIL
jgi:hypothetical protein